MTRLVCAIVLGCLVTAGPAGAQPPVPVTVTGQVLWISGQRMVVAPGAGSVTVDLAAIPLDEYLGVQSGAWVRVTGLLTEGGRLAAHRIQSLSEAPGPAARERP